MVLNYRTSKSLPDEDIDDEPYEDDNENIDGLEEDLGYDNDGYNAVPPMRQLSDLLMKLTNFEPYLKIMIMEWLGMYWDDQQKTFVRDPNVQPQMNIHGARWCVNYLRTYARDNNIITTLDIDFYNGIMEDIIRVACLNIYTRNKEFGITKLGDMFSISNQLIHAAGLVLVGAGGSKTYQDFLATANSRHEIINSSPPMQGQNYGNMAMARYPKPQGFMDKAKSYLGM